MEWLCNILDIAERKKKSWNENKIWRNNPGWAYRNTEVKNTRIHDLRVREDRETVYRYPVQVSDR